MLIKMNQTRRGSEDCFRVILFEQGVVYDVVPSLAGSFIREGSAREATLQDQADQIAQFAEAV